MDQSFCEVENVDPTQHKRWLEKHQFQPDEEGKFKVDNFEGKLPVENEQLFSNIRANVSAGGFEPLYSLPYDERIFVMVCGGPSLASHLKEIREKSRNPDKYLVVCSNMTGSYLRKNGISPHVHFVLDPQEKKRLDVADASPETQYWINAACHPAVFETLKNQGIKPHIFLADFDNDGKAIQAVKDSLPTGQPGMMVIQGGTMAGLRAMNIADALGFRSMEYYGFDATVDIEDGKARPYAYEKKRGEAIIEVECDKCGSKFNTTLIFQRQVNEFIRWHMNMPWLDIKIIGGGLIDHYFTHVKALESIEYHNPERFTPEYKALQLELHSKGKYGVTGAQFVPTVFHAIAQLHKSQGSVHVLDYGSASGATMKAVEDQLFLPPYTTSACYDPFVDKFSGEPEPADLVLCTDVLEHVEPECTKAVLDHIQSLTKKLAFFSISLVEAEKKLSDGRNAHINLRNPEFWLRELKKRFITAEAKVKDDEVLLVVAQSIDAVKNKCREMKKAA